MITYLLILIFLIILLFPLLVKKVEHNIELFLLVGITSFCICYRNYDDQLLVMCVKYGLC